MESETEGSPLLHNLPQTPRRRNICKRIPYEVTITGIILGLFLLVVTLLIVLENLESSSNEVLTLDSNLQASPLKYNKKFPYKPLNEKDNEKSEIDYKNKDRTKVNNWIDEWRKSYRVEEIKDSLEKRIKAEKKLIRMLEKLEDSSSNKESAETELEEMFQEKDDLNEINLLGSPFKYNKKVLDTTWQDKKEQYAKFNKDPSSKKWDNVDKGYKKIFPLGSPFMVDREELDKDRSKVEEYLDSMNYDISELGTPFMIDREEFDKNSENFLEMLGGTNMDNVNEDREKPQQGIPLLNELQKFYQEWKNALNRLKSEKALSFQKEQSGPGYQSISNRSVAAPSGCPLADMNNNNLQSSTIPQSQVDCALLAEDVRKNLGKCIDLSFLPRECKPSWRNKCYSTYKYRKIDGTCNNQIHPTWGQSGTPFVRMMAPDYSDGVSSVRKAINGEELPNARFLSQKLYTKKIKPDIDLNLLFLSFGLIVDHDMVETAINSAGIPCCDPKFESFPKSLPRECLPIYVPKDDPFYGPRNVNCLNFVRSLPTHGECIGRREQLNKATSFLDGSAIYGSTIPKSKSLRSFSGGQLRTQRINNAPYMMANKGAGYSCGTPSEPLKCFEAGDSRVNMLVELTAMHTLWYREHNRLADELKKLNPQWIDETLYQEARRILIAQLQHITYNEFLPLLLGEEAMNYFQLNINPDNFYDGYDDTVDPSVFNVFGAAAFRFGHSLVQDIINLVGPNNKSEGSVALHKTYFNPQLLYHNGLDLLLRGAASQKLHSVDSFITKEIREHLFQPANKDFGHDLAAVGIQRGRDHGLPSYTKWRSACGLSDIKSWDDLNTVMNAERANRLKEVYQSPEDIDLIPGALAEEHIEGSLLGPTYLCIIGRQFKKTRKGDRFWFEMQDNIGSFTKDQLQEIYNSNMARIVCDNSDKIQTIQKYPFRVPSSDNTIINCQEIRKLDLSKWKADPLY